jgi:hypothetical protein
MKPNILITLLLTSFHIQAAELISVRPLTDRILMLHFDEGYVEYHQRGEPRNADIVHIAPLDIEAASLTNSYALVSPGDEAFREAQAPLSVGRKSKGTEFAWFTDSFVNGRAVNNRPDQVRDHWIYLELPSPLQRHQTYTLTTGDLADNGKEWTFEFIESDLRSEAVHVNTLGYVPLAPQKFGYVYHWMGDKGPLDLEAYKGTTFHLIDTNTGEAVFTGELVFRMPRTQQETAQKTNTPNGNFLGADVWECDFSAFTTPGTYVLSVDGIGASWPFRIAADVYKEPYYHVARSLYHNRSGIELKEPYTEFTRPAPHHPQQTPGFENRLFYSTTRFTEWGSEGGKRELLDAGRKGNLTETWGWYQDAGDWDSYYTHLRVAQEMLIAYEIAPDSFKDGELNIPESGNGIPDILDEAAWLPRFGQRLRAELIDKGWGTGGIGLRVAGDAYGPDEKVLPDGKRVSQGSWEDVERDWMVSGEDPWSTYRYAGVAAHLAHVFRLAGIKDPEGVDWEKEAVESYAWAMENTRRGDVSRKDVSLGAMRAYAAAALFRLTGDKAYEQQFIVDTDAVTPTTHLMNDDFYGPVLYALPGGAGRPDAEVLPIITSALLRSADEIVINTPSKRALRWGGNFGMPMLVGQQTTPWVLEGVVGYALTRDSDPDKANAYLANLFNTADYFMGNNSQNMTWITGVGPRFPTHIFHMDAWYKDNNTYHPGLIPYAHWFKDTDGAGPWDRGWPHHTVHPSIDEWPGNERYFANRCSPMTSEFTVHQQSGPAAAFYGFLHAIASEQPAP